MPKLGSTRAKGATAANTSRLMVGTIAPIPFPLLTFPGTGTPAGDPQEAEAISSAFFGDRGRAPEEEHLYVGSVKTVIGHTEGTAGIAGLLKASLAVQNGIVPPNLLFENLSPKVAPFYKDVRILTEARPWPQLAPRAPRRASVNSFGMAKWRVRDFCG